MFFFTTLFSCIGGDDQSPDFNGAKGKGTDGGVSCNFFTGAKGKMGLGTAYIAGFNWALERKYDYIFEMDADFSPLNDLIRLFNACEKEGYDVSMVLVTKRG